MIVLIEPVSENVGMYVPAYPLPLLEIASYVQTALPSADLRILSMPVDYGLPLNRQGRQTVFERLMADLARLSPAAVGISCTAIAQAKVAIALSEHIKAHAPGVFIFMGGYFPTLYPEEIFTRSAAVDAIVIGEGELPTLEIARAVDSGRQIDPAAIAGLAWWRAGRLHKSTAGLRFDLQQKAPLNLSLLHQPEQYDVLPYAFSRGCAYQCNFCMEDYIRPTRQKVPATTIRADLDALVAQRNVRTLLMADALFTSFELFPYLRSLGLQIHFETRCDVLNPKRISDIADVCGILALGFESASYDTLKRMNKVRNRGHYEKYIANTEAIFAEAARCGISLLVFMIAGYPGDTREDLKQSLAFAQRLAAHSGPGGHVFKIGECHVYPKTKIHDLARSLADVRFDDDGVFGQNTVRQPSRDLSFDTVLEYIDTIYRLSRPTAVFQQRMLRVMPFFRLPAPALRDPIVPAVCFRDTARSIFNPHADSLVRFREVAPQLMDKFKNDMAGQRSQRKLSL